MLRTLEYTSDDKVTRVLDDGVEVAHYVYDGVGRRVEVGEGASTRRYLVAPNVGDGYESPQVVTDATGNVLEGYVFAGEHPIARFDGAGNVEYLLQDAMGTVTGVVDAAGANLTGSAEWDAFGQLRAGSVGSAAVGGGFGLQGMWLDETTGVYYVRARSYDARTGRVLSRDPVAGVTGRPETMNPYSANNGNPWVWRDPSGAFATTMELSFSLSASFNLANVAVPAFGWALAAVGAGAVVGAELDELDEARRAAQTVVRDIATELIRSMRRSRHRYRLWRAVGPSEHNGLLATRTWTSGPGYEGKLFWRDQHSASWYALDQVNSSDMTIYARHVWGAAVTTEVMAVLEAAKFVGERWEYDGLPGVHVPEFLLPYFSANAITFFTGKSYYRTR